MLLKRYGFQGMEHILSLSFYEGLEAVQYCIEKDTEDKLFLRWNLEEATKSIANLFLKEKIQPLSFKEYKNALYEVAMPKPKKTKEEVMSKVESILTHFNKGVRN